jgi:hypothetical protein
MFLLLLQGLLCQYPDGTAPLVMPPAHWLDAAAAAAENQRAAAAAAAGGQQEVDNGTGYFSFDDAPSAHQQQQQRTVSSSSSSGQLYGNAGHPVAPHPMEDQQNLQVAPAPEHRGAVVGTALPQQQQQQQQQQQAQHLPGGAAEAAAAQVFGNVGNGQASTWVTAAMHPQSTMAFA